MQGLKSFHKDKMYYDEGEEPR